MSVAYDHPSSDELDPSCLDDDLEGQDLERVDDVGPGEVDELQAEAEELEPAPAPKPTEPAKCIRCGERRVWDPAGFYPGDPYAGHCSGCRDELSREARQQAETERDARRAAELKAKNDEMHARFAASPHTCPDCQEKVLGPGRCGPCQELEWKRLQRQDIVDTTVRNLPPHYQWARFRAPELPQRVLDTKAIEAVRKAVKDQVDRILLLGPTGAGKTVLAFCALVEFAASRGYDGRVLDAFTLARARSASKLGAEAGEVELALECDALVIDELGPEGNVHGSAIVEVIYKRHAYEKPTIITSGTPLAELGTIYGAGIVRRMTEGAAVVHVVKGGRK